MWIYDTGDWTGLPSVSIELYDPLTHAGVILSFEETYVIQTPLPFWVYVERTQGWHKTACTSPARIVLSWITRSRVVQVSLSTCPENRSITSGQNQWFHQTLSPCRHSPQGDAASEVTHSIDRHPRWSGSPFFYCISSKSPPQNPVSKTENTLSHRYLLRAWQNAHAWHAKTLVFLLLTYSNHTTVLRSFGQYWYSSFYSLLTCIPVEHNLKTTVYCTARNSRS